MESYQGRILVEDDEGSRFYVHEYVRWRMFRRFHRYMLDTREAVRALDGKRFEIQNTGEILVRVDEE
ncbi:MAG TPA: hypothetical protein VFW39_07835 [Sphingomicrobium sp.]|nr:hypothetical protein [Sphingomicrobium sp.]